jgi:hypothetical protein
LGVDVVKLCILVRVAVALRGLAVMSALPCCC